MNRMERVYISRLFLFSHNFDKPLRGRLPRGVEWELSLTADAMTSIAQSARSVSETVPREIYREGLNINCVNKVRAYLGPASSSSCSIALRIPDHKSRIIFSLSFLTPLPKHFII